MKSSAVFVPVCVSVVFSTPVLIVLRNGRGNLICSLREILMRKHNLWKKTDLQGVGAPYNSPGKEPSRNPISATFSGYINARCYRIWVTYFQTPAPRWHKIAHLKFKLNKSLLVENFVCVTCDDYFSDSTFCGVYVYRAVRKSHALSLRNKQRIYTCMRNVSRLRCGASGFEIF